MTRCKKCGKQQFLKNGMCYKCYNEQPKKEKIHQQYNVAPSKFVPRESEGFCKKCGIQDNLKADLCSRCWYEFQKIAENGKEVKSRYSAVGKQIKVIIVDDEPSILDSFKLILKIAKGYEVDTASDPKEAMQLIKNNRGDYDMIITDDKMPNIDGVEFIKEVKCIYPKMPIMMCGAYNSTAYIKTAYDAGAFAYLSKPFMIEEAYECIDAGLALKNG